MAQETKPTTPILYALYAYNLHAKPKPFYVLKETAKQYVVCDIAPDNPKFDRLFKTEYTVKKASMSVYNYYFCTSEAAALALQREKVIAAINNAEQRIKSLQKDIEKNKAFLQEVEQ